MFIKVNIFVVEDELSFGIYTIPTFVCPLWSSFNGKFRGLNKKSIILRLILMDKEINKLLVMKPILIKNTLSEQVIIITPSPVAYNNYKLDAWVL